MSAAVLVTATQKRVKELSTVPTTFEKGLPTVEASPWFIFFARSNTPAPIVNKLAKVLSESLSDKDVVAKIEKAGVSVENVGPEETKKFLLAEEKRWSQVAKIAKLD